MKKFLIALWLGSVMFGLAACGGDGDPSDKIAVTMTDFAFDSQTWAVPAGKSITLTLINKGANEHEWVLIKAGTSVTLPFDDDDEDKVYWEVEVAPGETKTATFTAPSAPGTYEVVCGLPAHIEGGMEAALIVK